MSATQEAVLHCDFCGKSQHEVRRLISGPVGKAGAVCICDECVQLSVDIIGDQRVGGKRPLSMEEMRLRDQFACSAMQGMLTTSSEPALSGLDGFEVYTAEAAYRLADAMLKARLA